MNRNELIKMIPEPSNIEVIVYNSELNNLLNVDVINEYNSLFPVHKHNKEIYITLKSEIDEYKKTIDNIYLYNKSWKEKDYLDMLKNEKKTYSTLYDDVKKIENNIRILEKRYSNINEKIEIQTRQDNKEVEFKKKNIDKEIEDNKLGLERTKTVLTGFQISLEYLDAQAEELEETEQEIIKMQDDLENDNCNCIYCGLKVKEKSYNRVSGILQKRFNKNSSKKNKVLENKNKIEKELNFYQKQYEEYRINLKNAIEFKKQDYNFYTKKSVQVLRLEAERDEILKQIRLAKEEYENSPMIKSNRYKETKELIDKYELSLENLKKIKEGRQEFIDKHHKMQELYKELTESAKILEEYKKYLEIYYKIYEQKINNYFGNDFKFKIFKFDNLELIPIFELKYKNINFNELNSASQKECNEIYQQKINSFY